MHYSLFDESLQQLGELLGVVCAIDNGCACVLVIVGLGTQLATVELENVCETAWRGGACCRHVEASIGCNCRVMHGGPVWGLAMLVAASTSC